MSFIYTRKMKDTRLKGTCEKCAHVYYGAVPGGPKDGRMSGCSQRVDGVQCNGRCTLSYEEIWVDDPSSRKAVCSSPGCEAPSQDQYVGGIYAGHYCEEHFAAKGFNRDWSYNYLDAGEYLDADDY